VRKVPKDGSLSLMALSRQVPILRNIVAASQEFINGSREQSRLLVPYLAYVIL
jgi:hypothetical protein